MQELIQLTNPELAMQNQQFTMDDLANIYISHKKEIGDPLKDESKVHNNLMTDFRKMTNSITSESITLLNFQAMFKTVTIGNGATREVESVTMDLATAAWFSSKFDHNLRARIVTYAFGKLKEDNKELVAAIIAKDEEITEKEKEVAIADKEMQRLQAIAAEKFRTYGDFKPLSKWKYELGIKETTTELMDILDDYGVIRTEEVIQKKRYAVDTKNVKREAGANIVFNRYIIEKCLSDLISKD